MLYVALYEFGCIDDLGRWIAVKGKVVSKLALTCSISKRVPPNWREEKLSILVRQQSLSSPYLQPVAEMSARCSYSNVNHQYPNLI